MMNRSWLPALGLAALAIPAFAAEEMVTFPSGPEKATGLLVTPAGKGPFAGGDRDPGMVGARRLGEGPGARAGPAKATWRWPWTSTAARSPPTPTRPISS